MAILDQAKLTLDLNHGSLLPHQVLLTSLVIVAVPERSGLWPLTPFLVETSLLPHSVTLILMSSWGRVGTIRCSAHQC